MRRHPHLYEVNARLFVRRVSEKYGRRLTLATVPDEEWQLVSQLGFDLVWVMGAWERSPAARQQALLNSGLRREYDQALPGWSEEDVAGSPYAIYNYRLDPALGEPEGLAQLKSRLNRLGVGLVLDFVPNHLAFDHPWTFSFPERFVQGSEAAVRAHPDWFFSTDKGIHLAHGRDPNFPPWGDTVQVNFFSPDLRQALRDELLGIAEVADGVRCDMAMLALNDIFQPVWGEVVKDYPRPEGEFWGEAIGEVKRKRPGFLFLAEAYWGLEGRLQELGFDFTYDKSLYDRLRLSTPDEVRRHLTLAQPYQWRSVRFIENHDEPRAVTAFGRQRSLAAAVVLATIPGLRLFHDGQLEGRRTRLPVQLVREPREDTDTELRQFYERLLAVSNHSSFHEGEWGLTEVGSAWAGNESHRNLLAWTWHNGGYYRIVAVNYSPDQAQGWLKLQMPSGDSQIHLRDELAGTTYVRDQAEMNNRGLYVDLAPYQAQLFDTVAY